MQTSPPAFSTDVVPVAGVEDASSVVLRGRATYDQAQRLRSELLERVETATTSKLVLFLGDVERMDTAGAAVVVEALRLGHELGKKVLICSASPSVVGMFRLAGFEEALEFCTSCPEETLQRLTA